MLSKCDIIQCLAIAMAAASLVFWLLDDEDPDEPDEPEDIMDTDDEQCDFCVTTYGRSGLCQLCRK